MTALGAPAGTPRLRLTAEPSRQSISQPRNLFRNSRSGREGDITVTHCSTPFAPAGPLGDSDKHGRYAREIIFVS